VHPDDNKVSVRLLIGQQQSARWLSGRCCNCDIRHSASQQAGRTVARCGA